ncbi:MAG: hypothetical protein K6B15_07980 [Parasporobacterium sp.]|nr:hypothetical protein [Parasporobacterium sp.]
MSYRREYVQNLINGFMGTTVIYAACELGIFDKLKERNKSESELAEEIGCKKDEIKRLVRPLQQYNLLEKSESRLMLTEIGMCLTNDCEESLKKYALFCGRESIKAWGLLYPAIKQNTSPQKLINELGMFEDMERDENRFSTFDAMMSSVSKNIDLEAFFKQFKDKKTEFLIADVGGGTGTIITKFLNYYSNAKGVVLDLLQAKDAATKNIKMSGLKERLTFKEANFFNPLEIKSDVYVLSRVLHDWDDADAVKILRNISSSMSDESRLVIIEDLIKETNDKSALKAYMCDIQMWVFCNGKERTLDEFEELFAESGLILDSNMQLRDGTYVMSVKRTDEIYGVI